MVISHKSIQRGDLLKNFEVIFHSELHFNIQHGSKGYFNLHDSLLAGCGGHADLVVFVHYYVQKLK